MNRTYMKDYYDQLMTFLKSGELRSLSNKDRPHNATIVQFILDTSNKVNMYCGKMSVFGNKFYSHIDDDHDNKGDELKSLTIESLERFINKPNGQLNIIVENFSPSIISDLICPTVFARGIRNDKISVRSLDKSVIVSDNLAHCVYTDNGSVRLETDPKNRTGVFLSHIPSDLYDNLDNNFKIMTRASKPVHVFA